MYDSVTKFLIEAYSADYASWLLGRPIALTKLEPSELSQEPIRADAVIFLEGEDVILHIETQTRPNPDIFFRLLDYRVRLYRRSPQKQVRQVVIYLVPTRSALVYQTSFEIRSAEPLTSKPGTRHEFEVVRLWEQPVEQFLNSPGLLPLAALTKTDAPEQTLREVAAKIDKITDRGLQSNVAASAAILSALALDKNVIKQILRKDIMRESPIYQEILDEGIEIGVSRGKQEGIEIGVSRGKQEGSQERAITIAKNLLSIGIPPEQIASATGLTIEQVKNLQN